jgi:hypothetical protein
MPQLSKTGTVVCAVFSVCLATSGSAQDQPGDAPRLVDQITFSPARGGSVLQATGNRLRCDLLSMTAEKVVVRNNQRTNEIEMDKVRSIRSTDGKFEYSPAEESFESLLRRCRRLQGVSLSKLEVFDDVLPEDPVKPEAPRPGDQASITGAPPGAGTNEAATANPPETTNAEAGEGTAPTTGNNGGTSVCANCGKEIPPTLQNGERCPHCQIIFWDPNRPIGSPPHATGSAAGSNAGPPSTVTQPGANVQYPTGSGTGTAVAAPPPAASVPRTSVGNSLSNAPMWMKVGLFAGMLGIGWLLLQRR